MDRIWRAGANENTIIFFSDTVKINGSLLVLGKYGLNMIPSKENKWTIIVSKISTSWGSFTYGQAEDALRVKSKFVASEEQNEWLRYEFTEPSENSVVLSLAWKKFRVPFNIEVDVHRIVVQQIRQEYLRGVSNFDWTSGHYAAGYWFQNKINDQEALQFINRSIINGSSFANNSLKASILGRMGNSTDAISARQMAIAFDNSSERDGYARNVLLRNKNVKEAMQVFTENVRRHPGIWPTDGGLARGYSAQGNFKEALKYARKAMNYAQSQTDNQACEAALKFWTKAVVKLEKK